MNCLECQDWLQRRLDGENLPLSEAVERHWAVCANCCEQHAAALRLLEGLKQIPRPLPTTGFAQRLTAKVLQDRRQRRAKLRRRVLVTMALAASVLILLVAGYSWLPRTAHDESIPVPPLVKAQPKKNEPAPLKNPLSQSPKKQEARNALASLTERWVDTTRDHAKVVIVAANLDAVEDFPAMKELPALDPSVREAGEEVSEGVRAVTQNTRRAFDFFTRELPMPEVEPQRN